MANAAGSGGKSAARLKRRNETKMIMRQPIMLIAILAVIVLLLLFVVYPLVKVLIFSLTDETGAFSLATAAEIFSTSRYLKTFGRTMALGLIVAVIATFIGYIFAYTITRTNVPCKGFLKPSPPCPSCPRPLSCACPSSSCSGGRAHHQLPAGHHRQQRLRHGQSDRGAGPQLLPHRLYDPLRHPLLHRRIGGGRRLQHGRQPVAHLLDGHLSAVPAGHHLRLPAGVHPVSGGLLQPRHHRRRFHHLICGSLSNHHRQL